MFINNDEVFKTLTIEGILKVERGVFQNKNENECVVLTNNGNKFYLDEKFFDKYDFKKIFYSKIKEKIEAFKCRRKETNKRRKNRLGRIED